MTAASTRPRVTVSVALTARIAACTATRSRHHRRRRPQAACAAMLASACRTGPAMGTAMMGVTDQRQANVSVALTVRTVVSIAFSYRQPSLPYSRHLNHHHRRHRSIRHRHLLHQPHCRLRRLHSPHHLHRHKHRLCCRHCGHPSHHLRFLFRRHRYHHTLPRFLLAHRSGRHRQHQARLRRHRLSRRLEQCRQERHHHQRLWHPL